MGYGVYERQGRWKGYAVPALCDHPDCSKEIDRGLPYICGDIDGETQGCGLYFCDTHLLWPGYGDDDQYEGQMCERCLSDEEPFTPKPDIPEWNHHILTDEDWAGWREKNWQQAALINFERWVVGHRHVVCFIDDCFTPASRFLDTHPDETTLCEAHAHLHDDESNFL